VYNATWPFTANGSVPLGPLDAAVRESHDR
jgi:hypothetical protein